MKCVRCGSEMKEDDRACLKCGALNYNNPLNKNYVERYGNKQEKKLSGFGEKLRMKRKRPLYHLLVATVVIVVLIILFFLFKIIFKK